MWDIWKSTSRTLQHADKHLRAVEGAQGKVCVTRKTVRTVRFGGLRRFKCIDQNAGIDALHGRETCDCRRCVAPEHVGQNILSHYFINVSVLFNYFMLHNQDCTKNRHT